MEKVSFNAIKFQVIRQQKVKILKGGVDFISKLYNMCVLLRAGGLEDDQGGKLSQVPTRIAGSRTPIIP